MKILGVLSCFVVLFLIGNADANASMRKLMRKVHKKLGPDVIPIGKNNEAVNLTMSVTLNNILSVDFTQQSFKIEAWITYKWNSGATWPAERYGIKSVRVRESSLWTPDMDVFNGYQKLENQAPPLVVLTSDGSALQVVKTRLEARCKVTNREVVHTGATCFFDIGSWTYSSLFVHLLPSEDVDLSQFDSPKYKIESAKQTVQSKKYDCCPETYDTYRLSIRFVLKGRYD